MTFFDHKKFDKFLAEVCEQYEKSAPTVADHADDLYRRLNSGASGNVTLAEICALSQLLEDGIWEHPNYAANRSYKLRDRLNMDTTGNAGF